MESINELSKEEISNGRIPIHFLLKDSFYYPAAGFDGGVIKHFSKQCQSFVYCDYGTGEEAFLEKMDSFRGYVIFAKRKVTMHELIPNGWRMELPPNLTQKQYSRHNNYKKTPFGYWVVYERRVDFDENHGPEKFSLLYIGGEGVATYQALYWSNKSFAKGLAIIQPGTGFGFNWTDFRKQNDFLHWVVMNNKYGTPEIILYGGMANNYTNFSWDGYKLQETIKPYYHGIERLSGEITVWKKAKSDNMDQ